MGERIELASMRPGRIRPGNVRSTSLAHPDGGASMRPGRIRPGNIRISGGVMGELVQLQ